MSRERNSPGNGGDEEPATRDQIEYLRRYSDLDDAALAKLGKSGASETIDELREEQRRAEAGAVPRGLGIGYAKGLLILVLIAAIGGALWLLTHRNADGSLHWPESVDEVIGGIGKAEPSPAPGGDAGSAAAGDKTTGAAVPPPGEPPPKKPASAEPVWPPKKLPASYRATEPVELLAEDGSKVSIGVGQILHVIESPRPNIWKFSYQGRALIGSTSRVEGKLGPLGK